MNQIESIDLNFSTEPIIIIAGILLLIAFTIFIYRFTVPQISRSLKFVLTIARILALIIILLLIFEPVLTISRLKRIVPINLLFIDNSQSIVLKDSSETVEKINNVIKDFNNSLGVRNRVYTFGSRIDSVSDDEQTFSFDNPVTNFADIFDFIKDSDLHISSAVILSDGVITDGLSPIHEAEKRDIPIYTIGVGDTLSGKDIELKKILLNKYIYAGQPSKVEVSIFNKGLAGETISLELSEGNNLINRKDVTLGSSGINRIELNYTPETPGEKKLSVNVSLLKDEASSENNKMIKYVNVLKSKLNILLLAGSPSNDVSFIKNSLLNDDNLKVESIIQLSNDKFVSNAFNETMIDTADILFLIGFPSKNTSVGLIDRVKEEIISKQKPFFISFAEGVDNQKLLRLIDALPFSLNNILAESIYAQPNIIDGNSSLFKHGSNLAIADWNKLPPVKISLPNITIKPGAKIAANIKINDRVSASPIILTQNIGSRRCIAVNAKDIWRWKLKTHNDSPLFDSFIANSVKWLNRSDSQKQVNIETLKKIYQSGEEIEFTAQVYDETFSPVNNAEVKIHFINSDPGSEIKLNSEGNGFYTSTIEKWTPGAYDYEGTASLQGKVLGIDKGKFTIGEIEVEKLTPNLNKDILLLISTLTNGKYCYINNTRVIIQNIEKELTSPDRGKIQSREIKIWSQNIFLLLLIILFAIEWFLRKRSGMV